jgi:hypothetical protein
MKLVLLILACLAVPALARSAEQPSQSYTFKFGKVELSPFSVLRGDRDPGYRVDLNYRGLTNMVPMSQSELRVIAKYLGANKIEDLEGKSFTTDIYAPGEALSRLHLEAIHNGQYKPPTNEEFFEHLALGLAGMSAGNCPHTPKIADDVTVARALESAFNFGGVNCNELDPKFLATFNRQLSKMSNGSRRLEVSLIKNVGGERYSCGGEYFYLKEGSKRLAKISLAPGSNGFYCSTNPDHLDLANSSAHPKAENFKNVMGVR